ncbi:MAG: hypothetical protein HQL69_20545 [Magnetococcales bacterium]|nr:hypothetical protein [Magnetococcales bacterium]
MDANINYFPPHSRPGYNPEKPDQKINKHNKVRSRPRPAPRKGSARAKKRMGREAIKAGMAATLTLSMLTGLKIVKPMKLHGPVSWAFVGLTLAHTLIYEIPNKKVTR